MDRAQLADEIPVVCLGASGRRGLQDLVALLEALGPNVGVAVMATLHRPPGAPSQLRQILQRRSQIPVVVAADGQPLEGGVCYIGEPNRHLTLAAGRRLRLIDDPQHNLRNRTIDALFIALAQHVGPLGTGVVLSGSLSDGSEGLATIHASGGVAMAISPCHSVMGDMPRNAIRRVQGIQMVGDAAELASEVRRRNGLGPIRPNA